jgi:hypothetical protein
MKKLGIGLCVILILGIVAYIYRLTILMKVYPIVNNRRNPVEANRPVNWSRGPDQPAKSATERPPTISLS